MRVNFIGDIPTLKNSQKINKQCRFQSRHTTLRKNLPKSLLLNYAFNTTFESDVCFGESNESLQSYFRVEDRKEAELTEHLLFCVVPEGNDDVDARTGELGGDSAKEPGVHRWGLEPGHTTRKNG